MNLTAHFTLAELTTTSQPLPNVPNEAQIAALRALAEQVLEPWRVVVGALRVSSGYRSPAVNAAIGGSRTSDHMHGRAADVVPMVSPIENAWRHLTLSALPIDQAILYVRPRGQGWIHVSHAPRLRGEFLVNVDGAYRAWSTYRGPLVLG